MQYFTYPRPFKIFKDLLIQQQHLCEWIYFKSLRIFSCLNILIKLQKFKFIPLQINAVLIWQHLYIQMNVIIKHIKMNDLIKLHTKYSSKHFSYKWIFKKIRYLLCLNLYYPIFILNTNFRLQWNYKGAV